MHLATYSLSEYAMVADRWPHYGQSLHLLLSELNPDVVCINGWSDGGCIAALAWCLARQVSAIIMSESTAWDHPRHSWKEAVKRRIVRICSASLVGGTPHRDYIATLGASLDRVFTGYDAVDNEHFRAGAARARSSESLLRETLGLPPRFFLACSRFVAKKIWFACLRPMPSIAKQRATRIGLW